MARVLWGSECFLQKLLQSEALLLHLAAHHLCRSDFSTLGWSFHWYYFLIFCSHASLLEIVLQCVWIMFLQLALFDIAPLQLTIQELARYPAAIHFLHFCSPVELHCNKYNLTAIGLAVFQDCVLVNMSLLVMLMLNIKTNILFIFKLQCVSKHLHTFPL